MKVNMQEYRFIYGRWGVDNNNILTDIVTGQHCVGKLYNRITEHLSEEYTEIKFPKDIDGFHIDIPCGKIWTEKGRENDYFGDIRIEYFGNKNKAEQELFFSLVSDALFGNTKSAIELIKQLGKAFYLETEITAYDFSETTFEQACYYVSMLMHNQKYKLKFIQLGAFNGEPNCLLQLGHYFEYGYGGVNKNLKIAIKWYKKAAEEKSVEAMHLLSRIYQWQEIYSCVADLKRSFFWTKTAAEHGYILDYPRLSINYEIGLGCAKNYKKANYWYKKMLNLPEDQRKNVIFEYKRICNNLGLSISDRPGSYKKDIIE